VKRIKDLDSATWRVLRMLVRDKECTGAELRQMYWGRKTKDGTWFSKLVQDGLIEVVSVDKGDLRSQPVEHRTVYKLTDLGIYAAEYGTYEYEWESPTAKKGGKGK